MIPNGKGSSFIHGKGILENGLQAPFTSVVYIFYYIDLPPTQGSQELSPPPAIALSPSHAQLVIPYLLKRNLDEKSFNQLIRGELPPKPYDNPKAPFVLDEADNVVASPVELLKPLVQNGPCNQGIVLIESGQHQHARALFHACGLRIFGVSVASYWHCIVKRYVMSSPSLYS